MGYWNYRILADVTEAVEGVTEGGVQYYVAEVYYRDDGSIEAWSKSDFNILAGWETVDELIDTVAYVYEARKKLVLRNMGDKLVPWA